MTIDRRLARETAPFAVATLLGFAVIPLTSHVEWTGYAEASALMLLVAGIVLLAPWDRLPPMVRVVPSLLFLLSAALLREASGVIAGVGALTLIPVFWVALHGSRSQLVVLIGGVCAFFVSPIVVAGDPEFPVKVWWRIALVFSAASAITGFAVQNLVARVRGQADALAVRERDLEAVADLLRSLSLKTDARERICAGVCDLSGAYFAVLLETNSDGALERTAGAGLSLAPQTFTQASILAELDRAERPATLLLEPIHHGDEVAGVLIAGWRESPGDERRARGLVRLLATEAAFVIERADLLGRLTESALTDELTGLPNRRAWDERLEQAIAEAQPACIAILDLDHFKSYNDDHGHQAGDRFLKEAAAAWRAQLRPGDMLARYGGEEFVVLLREDDLDNARDIVDRLRAVTPRDQSCSAGIAGRLGDEPAADLLGRADHALYEAKRAGRDRSLIANRA
ncbi:MAG TPA: diguanylate cyclase [Thermoleophilaceae bacterium]|nr:diguanylate cyclase [Thermoleophilaceae bacterium]